MSARGCFDHKAVDQADCIQAGAADITPSVTLDDATATAEKALGGTYNGHPTALEFVVQPGAFAALTYSIQIENDTARTSYAAYVDAHNNTLVSLTDFVAKSSVRSAKQLESANSNSPLLSFFLVLFLVAVPRSPN